MHLLGVFHSHADPSAALVRDGEMVSFVEEERLCRVKHAYGRFPSRAVRAVLDLAGVSLSEVEAVVQGWDCAAYEDGRMAAHYERVNAATPTTAADLAYQQRQLENLGATRQRELIHRELRREFGGTEFPPVVFVRHHLAHACMAYQHAGMRDTLVLTVDGSGEWITTAWWHGKDGRLDLLREVHVPHSLGWFYSAFTEYLGFDAYDGEYKVMGLAAYGEPRPELRAQLEKLVWPDGQGGFASDPMILVRGPRSHSHYFPDQLVRYLGHPPRSRSEEITPWHMSLAHEVQQLLETVVLRMLGYWVEETGLRRLAVAGGVGLNVKLNGRLLTSGLLDQLFVHPLCADAGVPIGAALAYEYGREGSLELRPLEHLFLGPSFDDDEIRQILVSCQLPFRHEEAVEERVAELLAQGKVVGWFQGRMEGGPRALGARSILADPRTTASRDRVNAVIKFREFWRPFCPSMTAEGARRFLGGPAEAPFMILALPATAAARREIPAVVHVDGSTRPQVVDPRTNPAYHRLLTAFERRTGVPCLLNTSFNIKGEPIVCTPHDALRSYAATGMDALALGSFLLLKEER